jgi:hypothetical protein
LTVCWGYLKIRSWIHCLTTANDAALVKSASKIGISYGTGQKWSLELN